MSIRSNGAAVRTKMYCDAVMRFNERLRQHIDNAGQGRLETGRLSGAVMLNLGRGKIGYLSHPISMPTTAFGGWFLSAQGKRYLFFSSMVFFIAVMLLPVMNEYFSLEWSCLLQR